MFSWYARNVRHTRKKKGRSRRVSARCSSAGGSGIFGSPLTATNTHTLPRPPTWSKQQARTGSVSADHSPASSLAPLHETVTVAELVDDYAAVRRTTTSGQPTTPKRANLEGECAARRKCLQGPFGRIHLPPQDLKNYRELRKAIGRKDATINNELLRTCGRLFYGQKQTPKRLLRFRTS